MLIDNFCNTLRELIIFEVMKNQIQFNVNVLKVQICQKGVKYFFTP